MTIQVAVLCDAAAEYQGKLSLLGTFNTIYASQFPAAHPQCSVALRIVFEKAEEGKHHVRMSFIDEDGRPIMPALDLPFDVTFPEESLFFIRNFILNIQQLRFEKAGSYSIDIAVDGRHEASIPVQVRLAPPGAKPGLPS